MRIDRLGTLGSAATVVRAIAASASRLGLPPPAALTGDWFGSGAVIAPSVTVAPVAPAEAFTVPPGAGRGRSGAAGSATCRIPTVPVRGSPRRPAAGPTASCAATSTESGGTKAFPAQRCRIGFGLPSRRLRIPGRGASTGPRPTATAHRTGVLACLAAIAAGEVYQACVCTQFTGGVERIAAGFLRRRRRADSSRPRGLSGGPWGAVASLSPELFLRRRGPSVTSSPIKGTLPRHADPAALRASVKDVAENIMIVDLVRNDLGRVAVHRLGRVPELLVVKPLPASGTWCRRCRRRFRSNCRCARCWMQPFHRLLSPAHRNTVRANCFRAGSQPTAGSIAAQSVSRHRSRAPS